MTRVQRLELLKQIEKDIYVPSIESTFLDDAKSCAIHSVIEELEQEPILDKVRAEIEKLRPNLRPEQMTDYDYAMVGVVNDIVAIFDKYKAEAENP